MTCGAVRPAFTQFLLLIARFFLNNDVELEFEKSNRQNGFNLLGWKWSHVVFRAVSKR